MLRCQVSGKMQERLGLEILPETQASCSLLSGLLTMVESGLRKKKVGPQCLLHARALALHKVSMAAVSPQGT